MDKDDAILTITAESDHMNQMIGNNPSILPPLTISDLSGLDTISIDSSYNYTGPVLSSGSAGMFQAPNFTFHNMPQISTNWTSSTNPSSSLNVKGTAEFEGDVKIKGHSILHLLQKIENRLAILQEPDPDKLEKFAALKKAYEHYKTLERLIGDE